jgi:hypothetical protein
MGYFTCRSVQHERLLALVSYDQMLRVNVDTVLATIREWGTNIVDKFSHGYASKEGCRTEHKSRNLEYAIRLTGFTT